MLHPHSDNGLSPYRRRLLSCPAVHGIVFSRQSPHYTDYAKKKKVPLLSRKVSYIKALPLATLILQEVNAWKSGRFSCEPC